MKANEFIKQYGLDKAKKVLFNAGKYHQLWSSDNKYWTDNLAAISTHREHFIINLEELKTAVEAWGKINELGGIEKAIEITNQKLPLHNVQAIKELLQVVQS